MIFLHRIALSCLILLVLAGCGATVMPAPTNTPRPTMDGQLRPYQTATLAVISAATPTLTPLPPPPSPTPTPFVHMIVKGDTLLGIAFLYGIALDEIMAANPGIDPSLLVVGQAVVIPLNGQEAVSGTEPALPALFIDSPHCFSEAGGGGWCLVSVKNNQTEAWESLSLRFMLLDSQGALLTETVAAAPFNLLPPGASLPVAAYWRHFPTAWQSLAVFASLADALPVSAPQERYAAAVVEDAIVTISPGNLAGQAAGRVRLTEPARRVWILGVAYDAEDRPVGLRRLELLDPCLDGAASCGTLAFEVEVYSLGPEIARLEILAEARR